MGSPLSLSLSWKAIDTFELKPTLWLRYVDDTFVIWTDRYLHALPNHHPSQKRGVISALTERARRICEPEHLERELKYLKVTLRSNGYNASEIRKAMKPKNITVRKAKKDQMVARAYLPFIPRVTDRIGKLLDKHDIETVFKPTRKIQQSLRSAKDKRDPLSVAGVYRKPCTCGKVYIGTTKRSMGTRLKEHKRNCRLGQADKSAVAEHALSEGDHIILFENTELIAPNHGYHSRLVREVIEIHKHTENFNSEEGEVYLNRIWNPILRNSRITNRMTTGSKIVNVPGSSAGTSTGTNTTDYLTRHKYALRSLKVSQRTASHDG
ncbi:uncharacterized protein [Leptinotarsa decemlineata]|uniref:uncharacterized protein n=1 Tax=Leptinotarsa decemlineata TaxID=7539 RepID=UPI003D30CF1B